MAHKAAILLALCAVAVHWARASADTTESECRADGTCEEVKSKKPAPGSENVMLQTNSAEKKMMKRAEPDPKLGLLQADAHIAKTLKQTRADPNQIATTVQKGLSAVMKCVTYFMKQPPEVKQGLDALGHGLLDAVSAPIKAHYSTTAEYQAFEAEWMMFFDEAANTAPSVQGNISVFQAEGRPEAVILAIGDILILLSDGIIKFVPQETAQEVAKYVDAVGDLLSALGTGWTGFESGQEAQAIEDLYFAMRSVLDTVLPEELRNDETYKMVIGVLDTVIDKLTETVAEFQKQIVEGAVCWKVTQKREKKRPNVCQDGFYWGGEAFCLPSPTNAPERKAASTPDDAVSRKLSDGAAKGKQKLPDGAMVATCDESTAYTEKHGHWCYADCPKGMNANGLQCQTRCEGEFPADDGAALCGHNPGVIAEAIMNMAMGVVNGAINSGLLISSMKKDGVDTESLGHTINAFVNMGKGFAYKQCGK